MPSSSVTSINRYPGELQPLTCVIFFFFVPISAFSTAYIKKEDRGEKGEETFCIRPIKDGKFHHVYKPVLHGIQREACRPHGGSRSQVCCVPYTCGSHVPTFPSLLMLNSQNYEQ